jgi:hypothetical protein
VELATSGRSSIDMPSYGSAPCRIGSIQLPPRSITIKTPSPAVQFWRQILVHDADGDLQHNQPSPLQLCRILFAFAYTTSLLYHNTPFSTANISNIPCLRIRLPSPTTENRRILIYTNTPNTFICKPPSSV